MPTPASATVANPIIEHWTETPAQPDLHPGTDADAGVGTIAVHGLDDDALARVGDERALALDPAELAAVRDHFESLGRDPTDVELETIAQTWSEHSAHKTFRATVMTADGTALPPLLDRLRAATDTMAAPFVRSAFVGNAGIVSFVDGTTIALKAETHNHPSAVEPFGGANTGVGGVIRDVLGAAHRPVAVTDVLCFGPPDLPVADCPTVLSTRAASATEWSTASPTTATRSACRPSPAPSSTTRASPPTRWCSAAASVWPPSDRCPPARSPVIASSCSAGAPAATASAARRSPAPRWTPPRARSPGPACRSVTRSPRSCSSTCSPAPTTPPLWTAITDCGAGGLSSAVGEMADGVGADVELTAVPLKYPGLAPWEIWLSEAQERMVVAVPPDRSASSWPLRRHGVELADLGAFTGDGRLVVRHAARWCSTSTRRSSTTVARSAG